MEEQNRVSHKYDIFGEVIRGMNNNSEHVQNRSFGHIYYVNQVRSTHMLICAQQRVLKGYK